MMWLWGALITLTLSNMMVLSLNTYAEYEDSWERPKIYMKPYVYRDRFPRKVLYSEPSKDEPLLKSQERVPRSNSLFQPRLIHYDEELELPYVYDAKLHGIQSRLRKRKELRRVARNDAELQILDMDPLQLKEALILGLRSLAKRQATDYSAASEYSNNIHEEHEVNSPSKLPLSSEDVYKDKPMGNSESKLKKRSDTPLSTKEQYEDQFVDGYESSEGGLSNPSLNSNNKQEDKLIESSEILTAGLDKLSEYSEIQKGPNDIEFQIESNDKKDEEYVDVPNDIVNVLPEKIDLQPVEFRKETHPKRHARENYQDSIVQNPLLNIKTLSDGRSLEISNFLTPDKNSIDNQMSYNAHKERKIIDISKRVYNSEENRIAGDDPIIHKDPEKSAHDEASSDTNKRRSKSQELVDDLLSKEENLENSKENENQKNTDITEIITDSPPELKNPQKDNQKDKNDEDSSKSNEQNSGTNGKDEKDKKKSNESDESSSESDESSEEVKPVTKNSLPPCPEYKDEDFKEDNHKEASCSSDDDCKGKGVYCCKAYSNLNKCWSNQSSVAMNVTPSK